MKKLCYKFVLFPKYWPKFFLFICLFCATFAANANGQSANADPQTNSLHFSQQPTELEVFNARVFDEPLIPLGGKPKPEETRALAEALTLYAKRSSSDDFASLTAFLAHFPHSAWRPSLLLHLGTEYYRSGYFSRALDAWERAWKECEPLNSLKERAQADRALGELARLYSKLGRMVELRQLLDATKDRQLEGPATKLIADAKDALWLMQNKPGISFRCGPLALNRILFYNDRGKAASPLIDQARSTTDGFSLPEVADLSHRLGIDYQMAFRAQGASLIVPAVVHWKVGHYAALLKHDNDRFLIQDSTFRASIWITKAALENESSGYFLVPPGRLPAGWRPLSEQEAQTVWGKGGISSKVDGANTPFDASTRSGGCGGMTTYAMELMLVSLNLQDTPVGYTPPVGPPVHFTATYNQMEAGQPATFYYSNLGQKWTCNWISYITDNPSSPAADVTWYVDGGGTLNFTDLNTNTQTYSVELMSQALLLKTSTSSYEMQFPDGSKKEFALSDGSVGSSRRVFLTQVIDPAGNQVQLNYDSLLRITNITDAIGQPTTFFYTNTAYPYAITAVSDPFGRTAQFQYNSSGMLSQITDVIGIISQYAYGANDFITSLLTPYGQTAFVTGSINQDGGTTLQATDPLGETEFLEFPLNNDSISDVGPPSTVPQGVAVANVNLGFRNSFFWDKKAYAEGAGDFTKAKIYHWLHNNPNQTECSQILASQKGPLENPVWFQYAGEASANTIGLGQINKPEFVSRVLDDGTTQLFGYQYNPLGHVTNSTDPVGRNFTYVYATNNVDLLQTIMTHNGKNELQNSATYNTQHLPLTVTDAAGQTTTNSYNARGQILSTTNPKSEITTFGYGTNGYLLTVTGHLQTSNDVTSFTYDGFGRVHTVTDTEGYTLTFSYDAMDRKTNVAHPDGTSEQFVYSNLDLVASADRLGRWTTNIYNADRQLIQTRDPLGRITTYDWCKCGALTGLTDPMGRTTTWEYDVESRPIAKHYADGSTITYVYENTTGRLKSKFDEKGQQTLYDYYSDNKVKRVSYPNATIATPTVTYTYDPDYNRVLTMQDGIGITIYSYNPITAIPILGARLLASVSGPLPNSLVTYQYDQLSRATNRAINGVAQMIMYDVLDRPAIITNTLGAFQYSYVNATTRLASEAYPNGQTNLYTYYNNLCDERLLQIQHLYPNGQLLSGFGYTYNAVGQITAWTNQWDTLPTRVWIPTYDAVDQLTNIVSAGGISGVTNYVYAYDFAGNRLIATTNAIMNISSYNALNQLVNSTLPTNSTTYEWDAENRLTAINSGTNRSEFYYDGLGRRTEIIEKTNGIVATNNFYLWCRTEICEQRDSTGANVARRFFGQGESISNNYYYYTRDHLGSVREALNSIASIAARYDYDPYGQQTVIQEIQNMTFAYTGDFIHASSGLYLTPFRPLESTTGRWLSRDPIGLIGGLNLYLYADANPVNLIDPNGLTTSFVNISGAFAAFLGSAFNGGLFFTTSDTYGFPDIGLSISRGGAVGVESPTVAVSAGYVSGSYTCNFQGRTDALEFGAADFSASAIYKPGQVLIGNPIGGTIGLQTPGLGVIVAGSTTHSYGLIEGGIDAITAYQMFVYRLVYR